MGKYNVAQLQDIVSTVNGFQNRTMQLEKLLTGKDLFTLHMAHMLSDVSGKNDIYPQDELVCSQCA